MRILPRYIHLWPTNLWLCAWSAPTEPATAWQRLMALRITVRHGPYHSKLILVLKRGEI
jgi:hypothetical protein